MIHEHGLAATGDQADLFNARSARFFHRVLNKRLVHDGQHFLRHGLGGGQETRAKPGNGQHGFLERLQRHGRLPLN